MKKKVLIPILGVAAVVALGTGLVYTLSSQKADDGTTFTAEAAGETIDAVYERNAFLETSHRRDDLLITALERRNALLQNELDAMHRMMREPDEPEL